MSEGADSRPVLTGTRRHAHFVPILLQKFFCTRDQNFFWLYTRLSCKYVGTSLPEDKLGDLGNVIEATSIGVRRSDFFTARKWAPGNLGLLQQYLPKPDSCTAANKPFFLDAGAINLSTKGAITGE